MAKLGDRIDRFTLVRQLGAGGMGTTWEAVRQSGHDFEQRVAIKLADAEVLASTDGLASFRREAALAASLRHPNIAAVLDVDERSGYIVCELVDGADLRAVLKAVPGGRLDPVITVHVLGQIARGLSHAHRRILRGRSSPVIHRDMSPGNVVIDYDGNVKIVDFGIAKAMINGVDVPESLKGKLSYMAPEQVMGGRMDGRVDQYALGVIAYEALTGVRPNDGAHEGETLSCILGGKRVPIGQRLPALASGLARIVERMLALRPEQRYRSMDALLEALSAFTPPLTTHRSLIPLVIAARQPHTIVHENGCFVSRPVDVEPILAALQPAPERDSLLPNAARPPLLPVRRRDAALSPGQQALLATLGATNPAGPSADALLARQSRARAPFGAATEADGAMERRGTPPLMAAREPELERAEPAVPAVARIMPAQILGAGRDLASTEQPPMVARDAAVGRARAAVVRDGQAPVIVSREFVVQGVAARVISGAALDDTAVALEPGSRQHASGEFAHVGSARAADASPNVEAEREWSPPPLVLRQEPAGPISLRDSQRQLIASRAQEPAAGHAVRITGVHPLAETTHEASPPLAAVSRGASEPPRALDATVAGISPLMAADAPRLAAMAHVSQAFGVAAGGAAAPPTALDATLHESSPLLAAQLPGQRSPSGPIQSGAALSSPPSAVPPALPRARAKAGAAGSQSELRRVRALDAPAAAGQYASAKRSSARLVQRGLIGLGAGLALCVAWIALSPDMSRFLSSPEVPPAADSGVTVHSIAPGARGVAAPPAQLAAPAAVTTSVSPLTAAEGAPAPAPVTAASTAPPTAASSAPEPAPQAPAPASPPTAADGAAQQGGLPEGFAHARVRATPHAQVWVDDQPQGEAAPLLRLTLPAGNHVIAVGHDAPEQSRTVELKSGSSKLIAFDLRTP